MKEINKTARYKKMKIVFLFMLITSILVGSITYYTWANVIDIPVIYKGIKIDKINVGGLSKEEAIALLRKKKEPELQKSMALNIDDKSYKIKREDLGYKFEYENAVNEAYKIGRKGNIINRYKKIKDLEENNINISVKYSYDKEKINYIIGEISKNIDKEPKNATFNFNSGNYIISDEEVGMFVNKEKLQKKIIENIDDLKELDIPVDFEKPKYTKEYYSKINGVIGEYTTRFANSAPGRKENIKISAKSVNGKLIHSGETVSYNKLTGPRSRNNGYKEAPIILNGRYSPGVGGGVCQTSSTLYNAILNADLDIVERYHHSIPPPYIDKGTDAVVTDGPLDLKFKNNYDGPIYISSYATNEYVKILIHGDKSQKDYEVKIKPEVIETVPPGEEHIVDKSLSPGSKVLKSPGRYGYKVKTYKLKIKNGEVISKEQISYDNYQPKNAVYRIGP